MNARDSGIRVDGGRLYLEQPLTRGTVPELYAGLRRTSADGISSVDLGGVESVDSAGIAFLEDLRLRSGGELSSFYCNASEALKQSLDLFALSDETRTTPPERESIFVGIGDRLYGFYRRASMFLILASNIFYWSATDIFLTRYRRRGEVAKQSIQIGLDAVPIVGLLSLIIGLIIALQSAAQLRQFGAGIFVVDLIAISMVREMGPMITSILIAGRSGSAISAEIATMKVTEELDALKVMALEPIRFVIVPKAMAMSLTLPLLVGISIITGIAAGMVVSWFYLGISLLTFINQVFEVMKVADLAVGLGKSFFFGWMIVFVSSYCGMKTSGGAEGVGTATTESVVGSIFGVIALDALFSFSYLA